MATPHINAEMGDFADVVLILKVTHYALSTSQKLS